MSKRSASRVFLLAAVFTLILSISVLAETRGAGIVASTSVQGIDVVATDSTMLHQLVVPADGMVYFSGVTYGSYSNYGLSFSLLRSDGRPINRYGSSSTTVDGTNPNSSSFMRKYALKQGTYFIRVTNTKQYRLVVSFTPVLDQGKPAKKKGANLKRNKPMTALFGANELELGAKTEWFKIKSKKQRIIKLTVEAQGDASFKVYFYGPKPYKKGSLLGSVYGSGTNNVASFKIGVRRGFSSKMKKLSKGTYYVKIVRTGNTESGYCKVNWK